LIFQFPIISHYASTRGWPYIISWIHRGAGLVLVGFVWAHVYTLLSLSTPEAYSAAVKGYGSYPIIVLEWALSLPLIFHALNGGRLVLYESFGLRNDSAMIRWVLALSAAYVSMLGLLMILGDQQVSPLFYWMVVLPFAMAIMYSLTARLWSVPHAFTWRLQRLTGAFLLVFAPAHMVFMHLNASVARYPEIVIARVQNNFLKIMDLALLAAVSYHGAYGVVTVLKDYVSSRLVSTSLTLLVCFIIGVLALAGARLILTLGL